MEIDIPTLLKGKATKIKDKEYFTTEAYVTPFLNRMSKLTDDFIVQAKPADQISLTKDGEINFDDIVYNRVNIEAVLPDEYGFEGHKQVVGFVYALDTRKPVVKQYMGGIRSACLNLCTFNSQALSVQSLEPESAINYHFLDNCLSMTDNMNEKLKKLSEMEITKDNMFESLGSWIDKCINIKFKNDFGTVKLAESTPIEAYKNLFYNEKSDYYTSDNVVSGFDAYNAFTDIVCNSRNADLVNRFEKVWLVGNIMGV